MTLAPEVGYHRSVPAPRSGARPWIAAGALLAGAFFARPCAAATATYALADQGAVLITVRSATVTIRTWSRNTVQIAYPAGDDFTVAQGTMTTQPSFPIPPVSVEEHLPEGNVEATLLPEDFPMPRVTAGKHDFVRVVETGQPAAGKGAHPADLTVTIPETTGLVTVRSGRGTVIMRDYAGTTIAVTYRGRIFFENVGGDAFVQALGETFYALDSAFDRLRIRGNRGDQVFDGCRVKQIEATTLTGTIVFDNGLFDPGLARFESDRGWVALGVNGGAQLGAHTQDGHVLTVLPADPSPPVIGSDDGDALQLAGSGGPLVNASSTHGNVLLYNGSLADRRPAALAPPWRMMYDLLLTTRAAARRPWSTPRASSPQPHRS